MNGVQITRAREGEKPACIALMPRLPASATEWLIARRDGGFAGAAGIMWESSRKPGGFPLEVRVLARHRRRGVGRKLVGAAVTLTEGEADGIWSFDALPLSSPEASFAEACGFSAERREFHYVVDNETLLNDTRAIAERMRTRGRIPESAEVRYLREGGAPLDEIAWLISKEFGSHPMANLDALLRCSQDPDDHSLYVRVNDELVAAMLFHVEGELAVVDVRVAAKRWRNGWPNLVMLENALSWAKAAAVTKARMFCDEGVHDTINLARRGGEMVDVKARFYRYVAGAPSA